MSKSPSSHNYHVTELFDQFINGTTLKSVLITFRRICLLLDLEPGPFNQFYPTLKKGIVCNKNWKSQSIFSKIEKKAFNKIYHSPGSSSGRSSGIGGSVGHLGSPHGSNNILKNNNCLVIGGGPCGLRTAIELQLLGARHVIITEKRDRFSRNNVLHLWPFVIADLKQLAGKKFYGKFCAGSIDHVSIRQLQLMLLKVALIIGCEFIENVAFEEICPHNIRSSRETIKETSPESEADASGDGKVQQSTAAQSSPTKRKLYSTTEKIESKKGSERKVTICDSTTNEENQENINNNNNLNDNVNNNGGDETNDKMGCSPPTTADSYYGGKTESRRLSNCCCCCCCHIHRQGEGGRYFWPHLPKSYIGAYAHFSLTSSTPSTATTLVNYDLLLEKLHTYQFDVLIGGDGRRNTLNDNFPRKEFRGKLAIAITANFINNHTLAEAQIPEISGISFIYHQEMFKSLYDETGIDLENICYYKDDTHYFVMTAKKSSLLQRGVLINDHSDTRALLDSSNIDRSQLLAYARDAAKWTTGLDTPNFALNHYGEADVAMFDFTSMYAADNACRAKRIVKTTYKSHQHDCSRCNCDNGPCKKPKSDKTDPCKGSNETLDEHSVDNREDTDMEDNVRDEVDEGLLLVGLVGDSLLEPFWPTGSGCGRGFLSAMDAAWLARQWAVRKCKSIIDEEKILQVLSERESIYRLLGQTKSENLSQNCASYTINPVTRYPNLNSSTLLPHQCRHLLYDHLPSSVIEPRSKLTMAEKRARRATIATTAPFSSGSGGSAGDGEVIMESRARVEREFMAISRERERNQRNSESGNGERFCRPFLGSSTMEDDESNLATHREFEDSLAAFEENYRGLMASDTDPSSYLESGETQLSTSVPNRSSIPNNMVHSGNFALDLSPSASNLLTMAKSRARDIESAFRHRRQRQSQFRRSETDECQGGDKVHLKAQQQCINHLRQQLKSKAAWFLDQKANNKEGSNESNNGNPLVKRESFSERIKDLEAKLYAASGLSYLSDDNSDPKEEPTPKLPSTKTGINVMMTATQLQQLFNPKFQEEKLRQQAKLKATKDIKYVGKISKEDWNVKPFEEGTGVNETIKASNSKPKSPPPPQRVELFRNKLNEIQSKLEHIDDHHQPERRAKETVKSNQTNNGEWISMLKNELTEKAARKPEITTEPPVLRRSPSILDNPFRKEARREAREAAAAAAAGTSHNGVKLSASTSKLSSPSKEKITIVERSGSMVSKVCAKCGLIVATVDKILVTGTLFHRSCLKCISCGVTLRMSEVRNTGSGSLASLITGSATVLNTGKENSGFNNKCSGCINSKSRVNSSLGSSVIGKLMGNTKSSVSPGTTMDNRMTSSFDGNLEPLAKSMSARVFPTSNHKLGSSTDDYEARLKERMKWKEMFLLNNSNIDLRSGLNKTDGSKDFVNGSGKKKTSPSSGDVTGKTESSPGVKLPGDSSRNRLNERIEYENISMTSEMVDDDELTKLLNLGSDHWESGGENDDPDSDESDKDNDEEEDSDGDSGSARNKKAHGSDKEEDEDEDVDDEDRQTTTDSSESWDTSDSTDNDFDSDQFDESGVSDGGDALFSRSKHGSLSLEKQSSNHESIKEEIILPQIVVHKEPESTVSPKKELAISQSTVAIESSTSYQPIESSSATRQSSEVITSDNNLVDSNDSTIDQNCDEDDDSDKTQKNSSSKNDTKSGSDSDTINSRVNDIEDNNTIPSSTTLEEKEFQMIVDEMEKKTNEEPNNRNSVDGSNNLGIISSSNKQTADELAPSSSDTNDLNFDSDSDSKTSLSSLSINVSDTYDDINLLSIWDESGNCDDLSIDSPVKPSKTSHKKSSTHKKKRPNNNRLSDNETKRSLGLFKSKTDASIPGHSPYYNHVNHNRKDFLGRGLMPVESRYNADAKKDKSITPSKRLSSSSSMNKDSSPDKRQILESSDNFEYDNYPAKMSSRGEIYSKIPVLAARVIAANEGINMENSLSSTSSTSTNNSHNVKYKPSYSGSFTEKLLQRCRSSPSIPFIGDPLSRWSTPKMQLSSPTKVLSITKALNAQTNSINNNNNTTLTPSTKENHQPSSKMLKNHQEVTKNHSQQSKPRQQSHCSLPFADSENANTTQLDTNQQYKQSNRSPNTNSSPSSSTTRGQVNSGKLINQSKQNNNSILPRVTGATAKVINSQLISSSKLFQAPRATFDEDMFDDDESFDKSTGQHNSRKSEQAPLNSTPNHSSPSHHSHRISSKPSSSSSSPTTQTDQCKLKPIKVNYNF